MIYAFALLVSLCSPGMKECQSEALAKFTTMAACESFAKDVAREMRERGQAGDTNCYDVPILVPSKDSFGHAYDIEGRDD